MKKPKKAWKPKSAAAQIAAHKKSVEATRKRDAHPAEAKAKAVKAARATLAAARKESVKVRKWSPDGDVALCSARAVAESLRIALSVPVSDEEVLALHWAAGGDDDAGASLLDVLTAAQAHGLGGFRPQRFECVAGPLHEGSERLVLGLDLPLAEPHAVLADCGRWWSWRERYSPDVFAGAVIEEAWAVTW